MKHVLLFSLIAVASFVLSAVAYVIYRLHRALLFLPVIFFIWRSVAFYTRNIPTMDSLLFLILKSIPIILMTIIVAFLAILAYLKFPKENAWD